MADALYQDGGAFLTRDGTMTLAFASAYGGSTVVYTGTSLTAPQRVIRAWGVPGLEHADLTRRSAKYAEQNNVHALDDPLINDNNRLFVEGGRKAGYLVEQFPVNVKGCRGSSLCNLGCPNQAKQGTNRVQLPRAERAGVEVVTRAEVLRIEPDRTLAVRVSQKAAGTKGAPSEWAPGDYAVRARIVVAAAGAIGTSALLLRSPLPAPRSLGHGFTCHPALILVEGAGSRERGAQQQGRSTDGSGGRYDDPSSHGVVARRPLGRRALGAGGLLTDPDGEGSIRFDA